LLESDAAYAIIDRFPAISGSTWTAGACPVLAAGAVRGLSCRLDWLLNASDPKRFFGRFSRLLAAERAIGPPAAAVLERVE
jgi:hypothetical protein